jgi:hypothetical protein
VEAPPALKVSKDRLYMKFREGFNTHWDVYRTLSRARTCRRSGRSHRWTSTIRDARPRMGRILFDCAIGYRRKILDRSRLLEDLIPLHYA